MHIVNIYHFNIQSAIQIDLLYHSQMAGSWKLDKNPNVKMLRLLIVFNGKNLKFWTNQLVKISYIEGKNRKKSSTTLYLIQYIILFKVIEIIIQNIHYYLFLCTIRKTDEFWNNRINLYIKLSEARTLKYIAHSNN